MKTIIVATILLASFATLTVLGLVTIPNISKSISVLPNDTSSFFSLKCSWHTYPYGDLGSCIPPSCPEGFTDLGNGSVPTAVVYYQGQSVYGYTERWCGR